MSNGFALPSSWSCPLTNHPPPLVVTFPQTSGTQYFNERRADALKQLASNRVSLTQIQVQINSIKASVDKERAVRTWTGGPGRVDG